jgi:hypothetical protein
MKKNYIAIILLFITSILSAQNNDFTNGGADLLWSNTTNWSLGVIPNTTNTGIVRLPLIVESLVDTDVMIKKIQPTFSTPGDVAVAGNSTLTIDTGSNAVYGIENVSGSNIALIFKGKITINNSTTVSIKNTLMRSVNGSGNSINFEDGSLLTLNTPLEARSGASSVFNFNGTFAGTEALRLNANTISTFGSTSDNTGFEGDLVWMAQNASVVVNTSENNVFLPTDRKIQINAATGSIQVNTANVYQGNISINGDRTFTFDVNANQNSMGTITFAGGTANGTLNLDVDSSITELLFADTSAIEWNSGTLNITGYKEGVIRFGTDANGLTAAQLSQITVDGSGGAVALNNSGYLVNANSLSTEDLLIDSKPIAYPTFVSETILFSKPQENVKVYNLNGKMILNSQRKDQNEISVGSLSSGLYLIVFDDKKTQKFIKK